MKIKASWVHTSAATIWVILLVPTVIWWKDSVLWVGIMSLYANFVGHWSARQASLAKEKEEQSEAS